MPSAAVSAFDTKSPAPLRETCKFSTSLKSFTRERPAMRAAFIIVFRFALPGIITLSLKRKAAILTFERNAKGEKLSPIQLDKIRRLGKN